MSILEFVSSLVSSLAWPLALVVIAAMFRSQIAERVQQLRKVAGPLGIEAEFSETLVKIGIQAEALPSSGELPKDVPLAELPAFTLDFPRDTLSAAWSKLESHVRGAATEHGLPSDGPILIVVDRLVERGLLTTDARALIADLRTARNAATERAFRIPQESAALYVASVQKIVELLSGD